MFSFLSSNDEEPIKDDQKSVPQTAKEWCVEGRRARRDGDWSRAVVCFRKALELAPFCTRTRDEFENILEGQVLSIKKSRAKRKAAEVPFADFGEENPANVEAAPMPPIAEPVRPRRTVQRQRVAAAEEIIARPDGRGNRAAITVVTALIGILLTAGGLYAANGLSKAVGNLFRDSGSSAETVVLVPESLLVAMAEVGSKVKEGKFSDATTQLKKMRTDYPAHEDRILAELGRTLRLQAAADFKAKRFDSSAKVLAEATALEPQSHESWTALGRTLREQGRGLKDLAKQRARYDEAIAAYDKALEFAPGDPAILLALAQAHDARNNRTKAAETYEKIVALAPDSTEAKQAKTTLSQLRKR